LVDPGARVVDEENTPRARMVLAAAALLGERGLAGTSFAEVIERSGAARGSIYHHFPQGKEGLTAEAVALVSEQVLTLFRRCAGETPHDVVSRIVRAWRAVLVASECLAGCPIAAVSSERLAHPELGAQAASTFIAWERQLGKSLRAAGMSTSRADAAAPLVLAALEGALVLCRARRDVGPLDAVGKALARFVSG
jgi:TetR/AcrR family transcriptional regulator, lmrAB and yxaGH operons repressor